jgi:hypothetical protein
MLDPGLPPQPRSPVAPRGPAWTLVGSGRSRDAVETRHDGRTKRPNRRTLLAAAPGGCRAHHPGDDPAAAAARRTLADDSRCVQLGDLARVPGGSSDHASCRAVEATVAACTPARSRDRRSDAALCYERGWTSWPSIREGITRLLARDGGGNPGSLSGVGCLRSTMRSGGALNGRSISLKPSQSPGAPQSVNWNGEREGGHPSDRDPAGPSSISDRSVHADR